MAIIDNEHDRVSVRIVYDGPPHSGKTTSVNRLKDLLQRTSEVFTPQKTAEKTEYFDWLDYVGGIYQGRPIASQIVSVPSQPALRERRRFLLHSADAIVFVLDSRLSQVPLALEYFRDMQAILAEGKEPIPRVIVQANHQDAEDSLSEEQLSFFFPEDTRVYSSIATDSKGVRETFVMGVRLALEHLEAQQALHQVTVGQVDVHSGEELFQALEAEHLALNPDDPLEKILAAGVFAKVS